MGKYSSYGLGRELGRRGQCPFPLVRLLEEAGRVFNSSEGHAKPHVPRHHKSPSKGPHAGAHAKPHVSHHRRRTSKGPRERAEERSLKEVYIPKHLTGVTGPLT